MRLSPTVRHGSALVGIAGTLVLAGCGSDTSSAATQTGTPAPQSTAAATPAAGTADPSAGGAYKDGTYTASGSYQTPQTVEKITVTVTVAQDEVTAVTVTGDPQASETRHYQAQFIEGISAQVVGKKLAEINVSRVSGSSLTSGGFNKAIAAIRTEAKG
ncbi:MAG: FMN-binding protein [Actinobacteria bacterium]|nr:FMN-binding protein [Actinomycetota bacterium]